MKIKPKFIISKSKSLEQVSILKKVFDEVSYSWKTNPYVGEILAENNICDFSIHSINELKQFIRKTKNKNILDRVWYFPMALDNEDLEFLFKNNIKNFVLDNKSDLEFLLNYIKQTNKQINIFLRMKLKENTIFTGKHYVFGMKLFEIKELIPRLKVNKNILNLGIHFHRKTQNVSEWSLLEEISTSLGEDYLNQIDMINLGGGLPANYINIHDNSIKNIFIKIDDLKNYLKQFNIKLYIEPGRFIAAPSVKLETQIIAKHENTLFVNNSIFNGALDTVIANIKLSVEGELEKGKRFLIKGCTPDSSDILRYSVYLDNPKVGDIITFLNVGAYTYSTNFCALDKILVDYED